MIDFPAWLFFTKTFVFVSLFMITPDIAYFAVCVFYRICQLSYVYFLEYVTRQLVVILGLCVCLNDFYHHPVGVPLGFILL